MAPERTTNAYVECKYSARTYVRSVCTWQEASDSRKWACCQVGLLSSRWIASSPRGKEDSGGSLTPIWGGRPQMEAFLSVKVIKPHFQPSNCLLKI